MASMGSWCERWEGADFEESSHSLDSNPLSFTRLLTNSSPALYDHHSFLHGFETFNSTNKILPKTEEETIAKSPLPSTTSKNPPTSCTKIPGIKKRKNQLRKMMQIPMEEGSWNKQGGAGVPSDHWSWRKYGQKPIKGSPYPRGYYRCSSSKGCPARKQLERSLRDPSMLLITYSEEHNHALPAHRGSSNSSSQTPLMEKSQTDFNHHDQSANDSQEDKKKPISQVLDGSIQEDNKVKRWMREGDLSGNHDVVEENLFEDFGELPELDGKDFGSHSEEEVGSIMFDPFNLFDWSFPANDMQLHDHSL